MKKKLKKIWIGFLIGTVASVVVSLFTAFFFPDLFDKFENFTYDMRYKWKYDPQLNKGDDLANFQPNEDIVICDIDERSMGKYGVYHKWPRSYHGDAVRQLEKDGAAIVGFDIMFGKADFGVENTKQIEKILSGLGVPSTPQVESKIREQVNYDSMFCSEVNQAGNVIAAMQMTDSNEYEFGADWQGKSTEEWRKSVSPQSAARLPDSLTRAFLVEHPSPGGKTVLREKDALDGIFAELGQAAWKIGSVNVVPDPDGVHRTVPLFYVFRGHTYPVISLQMAMALMGTTLDQVEIKLGEYVNLGKPFKVWKDSTGTLKTSFPGVTGPMVKRIVEMAQDIKNLPEGKNLIISSYLSVRKDADGNLLGEFISGDVPWQVMAELSGYPADKFNSLVAEERTKIAPHTEVIRYDDGTFDLFEMDEKGEEQNSWEGNSNALLYFLRQPPKSELQRLRPGESLLLSSDLSIKKENGVYTSQCPVLRRKTIEDLIALTPPDIENLKPRIRFALGEEIKVPIDMRGHHIITYRGPARKAYKYIPYYDVREGRVGAHYFQHKAVIFGSSATALFDIVSSPFAGRYPGVEIHATLLSDFLDGTFMRKLDPQRGWLVLLAMGMVMGMLAYMLRPLWAGIAGIAFIIAHFLISMTLFEDRLWVEIIRPIMTVLLSYVAVVAYQYIAEEKDKKFLHETFKSYLDPKVIDRMFESKQRPQQGGEEAIRTAYFTDIQGFSTFSEKLGSPTKLVALLNEYLGAMTDTLLENEGMLDKYEGDAIIAIFGGFFYEPVHATRACATALKMQEKLGVLRAKWASEGDKWPKIVHEMRMRIGMNSGPIVTGNMGSKVRMNFTMMGDAVNLAARLESGSKAYGAFIMCSGDTLSLTDGSIVARQLDVLRVVGKSEGVPIHEVLCFKDKQDEKITKLLDVFGNAYKAYLAMKWDDGVALFEEALKYEPNYKQPGVKTVPSVVMKERCVQYKAAPPVKPGEAWDGVYTATSK